MRTDEVLSKLDLKGAKRVAMRVAAFRGRWRTFLTHPNGMLCADGTECRLPWYGIVMLKVGLRWLDVCEKIAKKHEANLRRLG